MSKNDNIETFIENAAIFKLGKEEKAQKFCSNSCLMDVLKFFIQNKEPSKSLKNICYLDIKFAQFVPKAWRKNIIFVKKFATLARTFQPQTLVLFNASLSSSDFKNLHVPASVKFVKIVYRKDSDVTQLVSKEYSKWAYNNNRLQIEFIPESHYFNKIELGNSVFLNLDRISLLDYSSKLEFWGLANGSTPLNVSGEIDSKKELKYLSLSHGFYEVDEDVPFNEEIMEIIEGVFNNSFDKKDKGAAQFLVNLLKPIVSRDEWSVIHLVPVS